MIATAAPLTQTPPPMRKVAPAYFERPLPAALILGSFFAVALPMAAIELLAPTAAVTWLYIWLFGITHFVVTLSIYCCSANLSYFASSWKTATIFFAVPLAIFVGFDLIHALRMKAEWPIVALVFFGAVRFFDFFHLNRQTFGVLQMFKGRTKRKYPPELRTNENRYLIAFVVLLFATFASGGVCPLFQAGGPLSLAAMSPIEGAAPLADVATLQIAWLAAAAVTAFCFARVARGHSTMNRLPFAYLILQSLGALMAAIWLPLYLATLAMHYVEYHVLMAPRCFVTPLDNHSKIDRAFGWLRERRILFVLAVLGLAALVTRGAMVGMNAAMGAPIADFSSPVSYLMLIAIFDGIFVFHYFVEMFIWKFSDPHFRKMLAGLYFSPRPEVGMIRWPLSLLGLALAVFAVVAFTGPGRIDIEDGQDRFEAGLNLLDHGDPGIRDPRVVWHRFPGRGGVDFTYYRFPGEAVAAVMILISDATGSACERRRHFVFALNGAITASLLAVTFALWFRRQGLAPRAAVAWAFGGIVCTPCWYYAASTFDDLLGTLAVVVAMVAADRARNGGLVSLLAAAVAVGLSLNCKQPLAAVLLPTLALADAPGKRLVRAAVLCLGLAAGYAAYVGYEAWKFPPDAKALHPAIMAELGLTLFDGQPHEALLDYLAGPSSGAIWYAPSLFLGVAGLIVWRRGGKKTIVLATALAIAAMVGFFAMLTFYKGGVCWGPRYLTPVFGMLWLFAPDGAKLLGAPLTRLLLLLGAGVQVLGLAVVPERIYVERDVPSGFYRANPWLYFHPAISHILQRPREIADAWSAPAAPEFTPGPTPTFTMPVFDPPYYTGPKGVEGVRKYELLNGFRPWWSSLPRLPREARPVDLQWTAKAFALVGLFGLLCIRIGLGPKPESVPDDYAGRA